MLYTTTTPTNVVPENGHSLPIELFDQRSFLRGEQTLNNRLITQSEIVERQFQVRQGAHHARQSFTVSGVRQLIGNTIIALGTLLHGKSETRREPVSNPVTATAAGD